MQHQDPRHGRLAAEAAADGALPHPIFAPLPRVFLHGFAGGPGTWDQVVAALGGGDAVAPSLCLPLPGHNAPLPAAPASFQHAVQLLLAALPKGPCHLVGYSLGGRLALALALLAPARVRLLTLVGAHPGLEDEGERTERRRADQSWQRCLRERGLVAFATAWQQQPLFASQAHLPPALLQAQQAQRYALHPGPLADALGCMGLSAMPNYWPQLRRLSVPLASICGGLDHKFLHLQARMLRLVPQASGHQVPGVGHNVALEAPVALAQRIVVHERSHGAWPAAKVSAKTM